MKRFHDLPVVIRSEATEVSGEIVAKCENVITESIAFGSVNEITQQHWFCVDHVLRLTDGPPANVSEIVDVFLRCVGVSSNKGIDLRLCKQFTPRIFCLVDREKVENITILRHENASR
ncbi:hypothetical protein Poly51_63180 [Rubripirellula tenax]|uniref:Uncharacterized protein n=1 Tax=Rubripirellula tenax TaxID=2528015 RepID=A0A5C6E7X9_9BACT|nr:hypothetical protein Poly51_63180 [Rubripirellula tenax]